MITIEYTRNYKSKMLFPGSIVTNRYGLSAEVLGRTLAKYSRVFVLKFKDGLIGTATYGTIAHKNFRHPIVFSAGNNCTNKYKTIAKRFEQIKSRCHDPNSKDFYRYGGRGISCTFLDIYEFYFELLKDGRFHLLLTTPHLYEIDRINNLGNYEAGNIRIATKSENQRNTRRNFIYNLIDNYTNKLLFTGIKKDCETWISENLGVKTSIDWRNPKLEVGKRNGYSVRHELA